MNHYEILGIDLDASKNEIKKAYYFNAKKYHPDHNKGCETESAEQFKKIQEAYTILSDSHKRKITIFNSSMPKLLSRKRSNNFFFLRNLYFARTLIIRFSRIFRLEFLKAF